MRGQRYKARDKTVRKMGRDGLQEENLRSGEAVRVSARETEQLAYSGSADDLWELQGRHRRGANDERTDEKRRTGYFSDFKKPAADATGYGCDSIRTTFSGKETEGSEPSYIEETEKVYAAGNIWEDAQEDSLDGMAGTESESRIREAGHRQVTSYD